jgi:hypothetical protein
VLERGGQIELVANLKELFVRVTPPLVNEYCQGFFYFVLEHVMRRACQVAEATVILLMIEILHIEGNIWEILF